MILHFRQTHMVPDQNYGKALGCDICDAFLVINGFSSYDELESHTAKIHGPDTFINTPGNAGKSKCPLCPGAFTYRKGMIEHLQVIHGEHLSGQLLQLTGDDKEKFCTDRRFKCKHCDRLFTVRKSLVSHMEKIHQDFTGCKFGTATVCDEQIIFTGKSPKTPTEGSKKSPSQRKTISAMSKWLKDFHVDTSQNAAIQQCPQCPQVFTRKSILDIHIRHAHKDKSLEENEIKMEESENSQMVLKIAKKVLKVQKNLFKILIMALKVPKKTIDHTADTTEPKQVDEATEKVGIIKKKKIKVENKVEEPKEQIEERVEEAKVQIEVEEKVEPPRKRLCKKSPAKKQEYEYKGSFYTKEELAKCKSENHQKFYDDSVACAENADPEEELEKCPDCERKFVSYFSMMRHIAFFHRPEKTASIMKLTPIPRTPNEIKAK